MVTKKKSGKLSSAKRKAISAVKRRKSLSASTGKSRLGHASLDWITDTIEGETILPEAKNLQTKTTGVSKETKIGMAKKYIGEEVRKKVKDIKEMPPRIFADSSTITKRKKGTVTKGKKIPLQYEIREKDSSRTGKSTVHIPEDSSAIVKKRSKAASRKETIRKEVKPPSEKKETGAPAAAAKEQRPAPAKRKRMRISGIGESLKKGSRKVSGVIRKPLKSGKTKLRKSASSSTGVSRKPLKAITAFDHKVTRSMKKAVFFGGSRISGRSVLQNISAADARVTRSAKKLINLFRG